MEDQSKTLESILSNKPQVLLDSMSKTVAVFDNTNSVLLDELFEFGTFDSYVGREYFFWIIAFAWEHVCLGPHRDTGCEDGCIYDWNTLEFEIKHFGFFDPMIFRICYDQLTRKLTFDGFSPAECWIRWLLINFRFPKISNSTFPEDSRIGTFWGLMVERAEKLRALLKSELSHYSYNEFYSKPAASNSEIARDINTIAALLRGNDRSEFLDLVRSCKLLEDIDTSPEYLELVEAERQYEIARLQLIRKVREGAVNSKKPLKKQVSLFPETRFYLSFNAEYLDEFKSKHNRSHSKTKSESEELLPFAAMRQREMAEESAKHSIDAAYHYVFFSEYDEFRWNGKPLKPVLFQHHSEELVAIRRRIRRFLQET